MKTNYYIGDNVGSVHPDDLKTGVRIICIQSGFISLKLEKFDGPYDTLKQLKKESTIFKKLAKTDPIRVQKILEKKNIFNAKNFIITDKNKTVTKDFIQVFEHSTKGNVKSKTIYGIHFFDSKIMKIITLLEKEDKNFVWKALVNVYDIKQDKWFEKESTFFPRSWSLSQLFNECDFANQNKIKSCESQYIYTSRTLRACLNIFNHHNNRC